MVHRQHQEPVQGTVNLRRIDVGHAEHCFAQCLDFVGLEPFQYLSSFLVIEQKHQYCRGLAPGDQLQLSAWLGLFDIIFFLGISHLLPPVRRIL